MRPGRILLSVLAAAAATGCTEPGEGARVTLEVHQDHPDAQAGHRAAVESGHHLVRVHRTVSIPADCVLGGAVATAAGELTLRVSAASGRPACAGSDTEVAYTATILGLRPGRYQLRVVHALAGQPSRLVFEHPILVSGAPPPEGAND